MTKEEIRNSIEYYVTDGDRFSLEKLPMSGEYGSEVNNYINELEYNYKHDRGYYNILVDELVDYYYVNQENYEF